MKNNSLKVNEIFYSLQAEGANAGKPCIFIRLSGCNKTCYFCDTKHEQGVEMSLPIIYNKIKELSQDCSFIIFTGGEPLLQLTADHLEYFATNGFFIGLETNGSIQPDPNMFFDYISVSPKVPAAQVKYNFPNGVNEIRYPLALGENTPPLHLLPEAENYFVSPLFNGNEMDKKNVAWCVSHCLKHPEWRLSVQIHKLLYFS